MLGIIRDGLPLISDGAEVVPSAVRNHGSVRLSLDKVSAVVYEEVAAGRFLEVPRSACTKISPLGVVPKGSDGIRLISDHSCPRGISVNDGVSASSFKMMSLRDALDLMRPGCFMAKIDIRSAYRHIEIAPEHRHLHCYEFLGRFFWDLRMSFGLRHAPEVFHRISMAVRWIAGKQGIAGLVAYLDDSLIVAPDRATCQRWLDCFLQLLADLGFVVNDDKLVGPCQCLTFLGVELDSLAMEARIDADRRARIINLCTETLSLRKISCRALQSLVGKLAFCAHVVKGGKTFLRRLFDALAPLSQPFHRTRITTAMREDLLWWVNFMTSWNGKQILVLAPASWLEVFTDASDFAGGAIFQGHAALSTWPRSQASAHDIHLKELRMIVLACQIWGHLWSGQYVRFWCDNQAMVAAVNKGSSRSLEVIPLLRELFWLMAAHKFSLQATWLPTYENKLADALSRCDWVAFWSLFHQQFADQICRHRSLADC